MAESEALELVLNEIVRSLPNPPTFPDLPRWLNYRCLEIVLFSPLLTACTCAIITGQRNGVAFVLKSQLRHADGITFARVLDPISGTSIHLSPAFVYAQKTALLYHQFRATTV